MKIINKAGFTIPKQSVKVQAIPTYVNYVDFSYRHLNPEYNQTNNNPSIPFNVISYSLIKSN